MRLRFLVGLRPTRNDTFGGLAPFLVAARSRCYTVHRQQQISYDWFQKGYAPPLCSCSLPARSALRLAGVPPQLTVDFEIVSMTQQVGIFGYPLAHSISPDVQQAAFDHYSMPVKYCAWPVPPEKLGDEVGKLRGERYLGANVTVPHKEKVRAYVDEMDPHAESIGAINTIVREGSSLIGYNTDAYGFIKALKEEGGFEPQGKSVLVLGAGGAARAAVFGLAQKDIASLTIANRTLGRARSLANDFGGLMAKVAVISMADAALEGVCASADLIVNTTSIGMRGGDAEGGSPLEEHTIPARALVYDLVYNPPETPLLKAARRAGARTLGGLPMLVYQGAAAFERWTGREAPVEVMFRAAEEALPSLYTQR